jgi:molecular chaperone GrpE
MSEAKEKLSKKDDNREIEEQAPLEAGERGEQADINYEDLEKDQLISLLQERDSKITELEKQFEEAKNAHLRKAAELENYRKRVQRERTQIYETAKTNALEDFLYINNDLRRTLKASEDLDIDETFLDGVTLVANKFEEVLKKHGVERIDEEMVPFDVDLHDAMMRQKPEDDSIESDTVLQVIENGYRIGDRTIRHAKVIVSE